MAIQWDDSLLLGFDEIDAQHKSIFTQFKKLSDAIQQGTTGQILEEVTIFLFDYTQVHFDTEDSIMQKFEYPRIGEQRHEHAEFTREVTEIKERIERDGVSRESAIEMSGRLFRWVVNHIRKHDRDMVDFVKEQITS